MCAGVVNAPLNLIDGVVDQADGSLAMAAFVRFGDIELIARGPEMIECRLHVRLTATGRAAGQVPESEEEDE